MLSRGPKPDNVLSTTTGQIVDISMEHHHFINPVIYSPCTHQHTVDTSIYATVVKYYRCPVNHQPRYPQYTSNELDLLHSHLTIFLHNLNKVTHVSPKQHMAKHIPAIACIPVFYARK